jgi:nicotinamide-nucleotide amidase
MSSHRPRKRIPAKSIAPALVRRADKIISLLRKKKLSIVTAESCTGGLLAAALSEGDGASDVLCGGFVTYTKEQKHRSLGVSKQMLRKVTAVAPQVAVAMAQGALKRSPAHVAIAVTGVLGPTPDEDGNPVGLIYFCCARKRGATRILEKRFQALSHDQLRRGVVKEALELVGRSVSED